MRSSGPVLLQRVTTWQSKFAPTIGYPVVPVTRTVALWQKSKFKLCSCKGEQNRHAIPFLYVLILQIFKSFRANCINEFSSGVFILEKVIHTTLFWFLISVCPFSFRQNTHIFQKYISCKKSSQRKRKDYI